MIVLALEASSSSAKAMLYDSDSQESGIITVKTETYDQSINENGKQDTENIYQAVLRVGREVGRDHPVDAVAISGIWHSICLCDEKFIPQFPTYTWQFSETDRICQSVRSDEELTDEIYCHTGCMPNITYQPYTLMFLRQQGIDITKYKLLSQGGYIFHRLTQHWWETKSMLSGMGFLNTTSRELDPMILEMAGISGEQFGELIAFPVSAPLSQEAADSLGIKAGIPVIPAYPDGGLNQIGDDADQVGIMTASIGTSGAIRLSVKEPKFSPSKSTWCYVGVGNWLSGAAINGAGNCIDWFSRTILHDRIDFDFFNKHLLDPGETPIFLPFLFAERCPGWQVNRKGGFINLTSAMGVTDLYRGICEGILFNLYQCYEKLLEIIPRPQRIIVSGGIVNSPEWLSIFADLFDHDIEISTSSHASILGAVKVAFKELGCDKSIYSQNMGILDIISRDSQKHSYYFQKYSEYLENYFKTQA